MARGSPGNRCCPNRSRCRVRRVVLDLASSVVALQLAVSTGDMSALRLLAVGSGLPGALISAPMRPEAPTSSTSAARRSWSRRSWSAARCRSRRPSASATRRAASCIGEGHALVERGARLHVEDRGLEDDAHDGRDLPVRSLPRHRPVHHAGDAALERDAAVSMIVLSADAVRTSSWSSTRASPTTPAWGPLVFFELLRGALGFVVAISI